MVQGPRILVVGSFMMDLIASTRRAPHSGETVIGSAFRTAPGGKGANQAVQCARLGAQTTMMGKVGDDSFGREMLETAAAAGVDVSRVAIDPGASSGVGHILLETGDRGVQNRITVVPGANLAITPGEVAFLQQAVAQYDLVMLQLEIPMEINELVAAYASAAGIPVMLNSAPSAPLSRKLLGHLTYISPNEHEAADLTGVSIRTGARGAELEDVKAAAQVLLDQGVKNVIVTLGENGAALMNRSEGLLHTQCVKMDRVADPTAAGDSFVAAFCTGVCAGLDHSAALTFASHTAAITVSRMGAMPSLPSLTEVRDLLSARAPEFDLRRLAGLY